MTYTNVTTNISIIKKEKDNFEMAMEATITYHLCQLMFSSFIS